MLGGKPFAATAPLQPSRARARGKIPIAPAAPPLPTSRDFVPWRFSDAGRRSAWIASSSRRPKTCTEAVVPVTPSFSPLHITALTVSATRNGGSVRGPAVSLTLASDLRSRRSCTEIARCAVASVRNREKALGTNARHGLELLFLERILGPSMNSSQMRDERLLAFYEHVRRQVALDAGSHYRFAGDGVRAYADKLMDKRRLRFTPIDWSTNR
jgi:hypothetical protein